MTLQSRLALDMLLLKDQGVCGMLNLSEAECCITIYNASSSIEEAQAKMKEIADQTGELFRSTQPHDWCNGLNPGSWITTILRSLGLIGWGKWLIQIRVAILTGLVFFMIGIGLVKCMVNHLMNARSSSVCYI